MVAVCFVLSSRQTGNQLNRWLWRGVVGRGCVGSGGTLPRGKTQCHAERDKAVVVEWRVRFHLRFLLCSACLEICHHREARRAGPGLLAFHADPAISYPSPSAHPSAYFIPSHCPRLLSPRPASPPFACLFVPPSRHPKLYSARRKDPTALSEGVGQFASCLQQLQFIFHEVIGTNVLCSTNVARALQLVNKVFEYRTLLRGLCAGFFVRTSDPSSLRPAQPCLSISLESCAFGSNESRRSDFQSVARRAAVLGPVPSLVVPPALGTPPGVLLSSL